MIVDTRTRTRWIRLADELRACRIARGKTLEQLARETRVPIAALSAIDAGRLAELPNGVVSSGFAAAYARAVGADPEAARGAWTHAQVSTVRPTPNRSYRWLWLGLLVLLYLVPVGLALAFGTRGSRLEESSRLPLGQPMHS